MELSERREVHKFAESRRLVYRTFWSHEPLGLKVYELIEIDNLIKMGVARRRNRFRSDV